MSGRSFDDDDDDDVIYVFIYLSIYLSNYFIIYLSVCLSWSVGFDQAWGKDRHEARDAGGKAGPPLPPGLFYHGVQEQSQGTWIFPRQRVLGLVGCDGCCGCGCGCCCCGCGCYPPNKQRNKQKSICSFRFVNVTYVCLDWLE